jgi:hypothetical protein
VSSLMAFESAAVVTYLGQNDARLLRAIVTHNRTYEELCK